MKRYPHLIEAILKDGHEIAHHVYIHEHPNEQTREKELYWVIERFTGQRPRGWRAPLQNFSKHSADLLCQEGVLYDATLIGDDKPYVLGAR